MKRLIAIAVLASSPALVWGGNSSTVGPGNPAAILCSELKGKLSSYFEDAGQGGLCTFNRGAIEEWTLFRHLKGTPMQAVAKFTKWAPPATGSLCDGHLVGCANPSAVYCDQVGGAMETVKDQKGNEFGLCAFPDGSKIETWTLFRGPNDPVNKRLARILKK